MSLNETDLFHTENKLARSIARIKTYCTGKKTLVAFSGGKDSQCCYHLCQDGGVTTRGKFYSMMEWGTPRAAFEHWLDAGMTMKAHKPTDDEPCLFAGTGFSESDSPNEQEAEP